MTSGIITVLAMLGFAVVVWWAYGPNSRERFKQAEQLPLQDEAPTTPGQVEVQS